MGGSGSSQSTEGEDLDDHSNTQANYGLTNFANESFDQPQFNFLEIFTFVMITLAAFYCLRVWCERRRHKKLENLRVALSEVVDHPVHCTCTQTSK